MNGKKARKERAERNEKRWYEEAEEQLLRQCVKEGSVIEIGDWALSKKTQARYRERRREFWAYPERFGQDNNVLEFREP